MSNTRTFAYLITKSYLHKALVSIRSIQQFDCPVDFHIAYFDLELPSEATRSLFGNNVYWHLKGKPQHFKDLYAERPNFVLELFEEGYEQVNHIGADMVAYDVGIDFKLKYIEAAFIKHAELPINPIQSHRTGIINSDLTYWINNYFVRNFLKWQSEQLKIRNDDKDGYFFDQVFLDYVLTYLVKFELLFSKQYGKAYYNLHEGFEKERLQAFHFSGFSEITPSILTTFNLDQKLLTPEVVMLALEYGERLNAAKEEISKAN